MINLLQENTILEHWPELRNRASAGEFVEKDQELEVWTNLQILSKVVPSILVKLGEYELAVRLTDQAR